MKMVEAIIQPFKFEAVKDALNQVGITGMTVGEVRGYGEQKGRTATYRGTPSSDDRVHRLRVQVVVTDAQLAAVKEAIQRAARTGNVGDGKLFVYPINEVFRIRTREKDESAL